ncbi:MAG: hypothetical protein HeimC2_28330 [Candidatus Heimdallarchaeota archaeon LC_2]|nr:MAG: hypothetical protein HeimC2_28330 [Candidatus Heimdallarchaeota archaeon LC_2]
MDWRNQIAIIKSVHELSDSSKWFFLIDYHFTQSVNCFYQGFNDKRFFYSTILHCNLVVEGAVKLLLEKIKGNNIKTTMGGVITILDDYLPEKLIQFLRTYNDEIRNEYTHNVFSHGTQDDALRSLIETSNYFTIIKKLFDKIKPSNNLYSQSELEQVIIETYFESVYYLLNEDSNSKDFGYENLKSIRESLKNSNDMLFLKHQIKISIVRNGRGPYSNYMEINFTKFNKKWCVLLISLMNYPFFTYNSSLKRINKFYSKFPTNLFIVVRMAKPEKNFLKLFDFLNENNIPNFIISPQLNIFYLRESVDLVKILLELLLIERSNQKTTKLKTIVNQIWKYLPIEKFPERFLLNIISKHISVLNYTIKDNTIMLM